MTDFLKTSFVNLFLRGLSLVSRFVLIVYIGKYLSTSELGVFGLFSTTVTLALLLLGLDFYTYNTREILCKSDSERLPLIRDQFVFHLLTYVVLLPLLLIVFYKNIIPYKFILFFYLILVFEHISQEFFRLFTCLSKTLFANFTLFIRTGLWVYLIIGFWIYSSGNHINLETVWVGWLLGAFASVIISVIYLRRLHPESVSNVPINWSWIRKGIKVSIPFFIGTIAY